jgi:hypothetical protein
MSNYSITFRIANVTVNGLTYDQRRAGLVENAREKGMGYWDETTSFLFVESSLSTSAFGKRVVTGLSAKYDMAVIFDPQDMSACYFGAVQHTDVLLSFLPNAKKLG